MTDSRSTSERYAHDERFTVEVMGSRTVQAGAPFLLPHLTPGLRVIDCGCGQASITVGLAELVAPGEVVGIDLRASDLTAGRQRAAQHRVQNIEFVEASIYEIPYSDDSFDAAVAHQVIHHIGDPPAALREIRRVLRPGGVVSIGDHMWDRVIRTPIVLGADAWDALRQRVIRQNGGTPDFGRSQTTLLHEAGFARVESYLTVAGSESGPTVVRSGQANDSERGAGEMGVPPYFRAVGRPVALEHGLATEAELDAMEEGLREWGNTPDAMWALPIGWALAWK